MTPHLTTEKDIEFFNAVYSLMINSFPEMAEKFGMESS